MVRKTGLLVIVALAGLALVISSCGAQDSEEIQLGYVQWACAEAQTHIAQAVIEDELGHDVSTTALEAASVWSAVAEGDLDAFVAAWLPVTHADYLATHEGRLDQYSSNFEGARIGLVVPAYVTIDSIDELNDHADQFNGRIVGIDGGAGIMSASEEAVEDYGLDLELVESSDLAMTAALADAILEEEWVVVTGWTPHWKFAEYDLKFLEDPMGIYGEEENVYTVARDGLDSDVPEVADFLDSFFLSDDQLGEVMGMIADGQDPLDAAREWIAANPDVVTSWLQ